MTTACAPALSRRLTRTRAALAAVPVVLGLMVGALGTAVVPATHVSAAAPKALIFGSSVSGSPSREEQDLTSQGWSVTVVNNAAWGAMTGAQFSTYQLLVFGDPTCGFDPSILQPAVTNESTWAPIVNGSVVIIGTDPVYHNGHGSPGAGVLISHALAYAGGQSGKTGAYVDLSCYYNTGTGFAQSSALLNGFEAGFSIYSENSCAATIHVNASAQQLIGITDADLSNWGCSVHEYFGTWPSDFVPYAIDTAAANAVPSGICPNPAYQPPDGTTPGCPTSWAGGAASPRGTSA